MRRSVRSTLFPVATLAMSATLGATRTASAQNADPFFFGDEAALASGAVVASSRDSGALWYNPAGYGGMKHGSLSASATTFGVRLRTISNALRVRAGATERASDLSSSDVLSVPNAVIAAARLSERVSLGAGLLTTKRDVRSALVSVPPSPAVDDAGHAFSLGERLDLQSDLAKYHLGAALGVALSDELRIGFSLFGTYAKQTDSVQYAFDATGAPPGDEHAFVTVNSRVTSSVFGVASAVGLQWEPSSSFAFGVTVRAPEVALSASSEGGAVTTATSVGGTDPPVGTYEERAPPEQRVAGVVVAPARILLGAAFGLGAPSSWLEIGLDAAHGLPTTSLAPAQRAVVNGRVGVRYMLSPGWMVGGGVFSDRATDADLRELIASSRVDWYGLTLGVSKRTPLALVSDPSPEALLLVTTFSLRAAAGFGQARAVLLNLNDASAPSDDRSDVVFYEIMPYFGSSVVF